MDIQENYSLKNLTTIKVGGSARFFVRVRSLDELKESLQFAKEKKLDLFIISGGSNVVISDKGFDGLVIQINIIDFEVLKEDDQNVWLRIGAGEILDHVVKRTVESGYWGIENLSSIPGRMGACATQNSGAYGQEVADVVEEVKTVEVGSGEIRSFKKEECGYGYRQSRFNSSELGKYVIVEVIIKLSKKEIPKIDYPDLQKYFGQQGVKDPSLKQIREAVFYIRKNKLPDMTKVGNAGSFFKNVVLSQDEFEGLVDKIRESFREDEVKQAEELKDKFKVVSGVKLPTAWLIDICGLKGTQVGHVKVYEKQPVVLITEPGKATADEVMRLFQKVRVEVYKKTGVELVPEPRLVGFSEEELEEYFKLD